MNSITIKPVSLSVQKPIIINNRNPPSSEGRMGEFILKIRQRYDYFCLGLISYAGLLRISQRSNFAPLVSISFSFW